MSQRTRAFWVVLALLALGAPLWAQSKEELKKAAARFEEGERHYKLGEHEEALKKYRESYLLSGEPALLFNIGQCQRILGQDQEALRSYDRFLDDFPETPYRAEIEGHVAALQAKIEARRAEEERLAGERRAARRRATAPYFAGAAAAGAGALVLGGVSLSLALRGDPLDEVGPGAGPDFSETLADIDDRRGQVRRLGNLSTALALAGLAAAGAGLFIGRTLIKLDASPAGLALGVGF